MEHHAVLFVCTVIYDNQRHMKKTKRVRSGGRVASLEASSGRGDERSTGRRAAGRGWRERAAELRRWRQVTKKRVTVNLDADVLAWFREMGRGYQWEINRTLRRVMEGERRGSGREC